jgi:hypothetical protein
MRVEQHRLRKSRFSAGQKLFGHILITPQKGKKTRAKLHPEHSVFHVISRSSSVKAACCLVSHPTSQLLLNEKEQIFEAAIKYLLRPWAVPVYSSQGIKDGASIGGLEQSPFCQHHAMSQIYRVQGCREMLFVDVQIGC